MTTGKIIPLTIWTFVSKVMSLFFSILSRFVIALSKEQTSSNLCLQSLSTVILKTKKIKPVTASTFSPSICHEVMGQVAIILVFCMSSFKPAFSLSCFTAIKKPFRSSSLSAIRVLLSAYLWLLFLPTILILCDSSSPTIHMMYSTQMLLINKQDYNIHLVVMYKTCKPGQEGYRYFIKICKSGQEGYQDLKHSVSLKIK